MALYITSLNSGSNGNCYYVGNQHEAVLIDVGISCRETEKRMQRLGLSMQKVKAIFISHEHSDHIRGVAVLSKKYQLPVYITHATMQYGRLFLEQHLVRTFRGYEPVKAGNLTISAFPKFHDAAEPHSFVVSYNDINVGVFTDIGAPCQHLITHFKQCHAAFLETNYDEQMLAQGNYPYHLKRRITGGRGHLSNRQALDLFINHKPDFMSHVLLSHLSKDNNCPKLARNLFVEHAGVTQVHVASRYEESPVFTITNNNYAAIAVQNYQPLSPRAMQYSLF
ncbi:MBL fold metallo-hydrolase [Mucilaginibacter sp. PAMB04274]|uniref:MBL fold metallo-hydrolase n=1 Tax=Mucilaginibacter sp. PAMB04274 TaxID=3138568 RepID=UPI0031F61C07